MMALIYRAVFGVMDGDITPAAARRAADHT
jgi:hypothetical protein